MAVSVLLLAATALFAKVVTSTTHRRVVSGATPRTAVPGVWLAGAVGVGHVTLTRGFGCGCRSTKPRDRARARLFRRAAIARRADAALRHRNFLVMRRCFGGRLHGLRRSDGLARGVSPKPPAVTLLSLPPSASGCRVRHDLLRGASPKTCSSTPAGDHVVAEDWVPTAGYDVETKVGVRRTSAITSLLYTWHFRCRARACSTRCCCARISSSPFSGDHARRIPALVRAWCQCRPAAIGHSLLVPASSVRQLAQRRTDHIGALFAVRYASLLRDFVSWSCASRCCSRCCCGGAADQETIA